MEPIRIQKYISDCGIMSRRAAEKEIEFGKIKINGIPAKLGQKIVPGEDKVEYMGKVIDSTTKDRYKYIMLNKPRGIVTTMADEKGRNCVAQLVEDVGCRVYPVGRLDMDSEGLLLLTNDGELANKLTHPRHSIPKIYTVKVKGRIENDKLRKLNKPMIIDGYEIMPVRTEIKTIDDDFTILRMTLFEGRNRQIRKMCEKVELEITKLQRIAIGDLSLGNLRPGKWRFLTKSQVEYLKNVK